MAKDAGGKSRPEFESLARKWGFKLELSDSRPEDAPVVVLMGWLGCEDRHLKKYSDVVKGMGYSIVRTTCPSSVCMSYSAAPTTAYAKDVLDFLVASGLDTRRQMVFYIFSNNGAFVWEKVARLLSTDRYSMLAAHHRGTIFDSGPAYLSTTTAANALSTSVKNKLLKLFLWCVTVVHLSVCAFIDSIFRRADRPKQFWANMIEDPTHVPQLYLYCRNDKLSSSRKLDELVQQRKKRGVQVFSKRWDVSRHCEHLRQHKDEYLTALKDFFKAAIGDHKSG
eukprot:evm.model.scf_277.4 EVM.evm.TU.scf_277.4   scf_277:25704-30844(-)